MFKIIIEMNKENIKNEKNNYNCSYDIYGILLKTKTYLYAKDIIYLIIG